MWTVVKAVATAIYGTIRHGSLHTIDDDRMRNDPLSIPGTPERNSDTSDDLDSVLSSPFINSPISPASPKRGSAQTSPFGKLSPALKLSPFGKLSTGFDASPLSLSSTLSSPFINSPISPPTTTNGENSATSAARRAIRNIQSAGVARSPKLGQFRSSPYSRPVHPSPPRVAGHPLRRHGVSTVSSVEQQTSKASGSTTSAVISPKEPVQNLPPVHESFQVLFGNEKSYSLPGFECLQFTPHQIKLIELEAVRRERIRAERERAQRQKEELAAERLGPLGLRLPKDVLIKKLSDAWISKAEKAMANGNVNISKWGQAPHPDGVALTPRDFQILLARESWLNDNVIHASLVCLATYINKALHIYPRSGTPSVVVVSSLYWSSFCDDNRKLYPRGFQRKWGLTPQNFLDVDTILIPVNLGNHWTLMLVRPRRRRFSYVDSFQALNNYHLSQLRNWVSGFLGDNFIVQDWMHEVYKSPRQSNSYDCGVFVITNAIYLALGIAAEDSYMEKDLAMQRYRIAGMLLNGGFTGEFDLSHL
ncbi:hypothetical protein F4778DRAFT_742395 [Xylariomycetidae sp. FL2044]|nr:hypothetical protein F4778DRAFT_742395 [Xylariomycetidae sp. FL2044]